MSSGAAGTPFGTLVEDGVAPGPGQLSRQAFLERALPLVERVAEEELAKAGRTTADCPYLAYYLKYYRTASAAHIERTLAKYARPSATDVASLLRAIEERVRQAVATWVKTGKIDAPAEASQLPGAPALPKAMGFDGPLSADPAAVRAGLGAGRPLDAATRGRMEQGFGQDFSQVRIHADAHAARTATSLGARAFTVGSDVAFGNGEFRPGTAKGDLVLAHELAHVVQQRGAPNATQAFGTGSDHELEVDADRAALSAVSRGGLLPAEYAKHVELHPPSAGRGGLRLQRCDSSLSDNEALAGSVDVHEAAAEDLDPTYEFARRPTVPGERENEHLASYKSRDFFLIDGDGDGAAELKVWFEEDKWFQPSNSPSTKLSSVKLSVQQLSTGETLTVVLDCGGFPDRFTFHPELRHSSDGLAPTQFSVEAESVYDWGILKLLPPKDPAAAAEYGWSWEAHPRYVQGTDVSSSGTLAFKAKETRLFNMWQPDDPRTAAGIWTFDARVGPYAERFRFTFLKPHPSEDKVVAGVSAFTTEAGGDASPWGAQSTDVLRCPDPLNVRVVENVGGKLSLDLSGKGCRVDLFDRFEGGHEGMQYGFYSPNEARNRTHGFSVVQDGKATGLGSFKVEDGKLVVGITGATSGSFTAASGAMAVDVLEPQVAGGFDFSSELVAVIQASHKARNKAVEDGALSKATNDAFEAMALAWAQLVSQVGLAKSAKPSNVGFARTGVLNAAAAYRPLLLKEVPTYGTGVGEKRDPMYSERISHVRNRFTGEQFIAPRKLSHGGYAVAEEVELSGLTPTEGPTLDVFTDAINASQWAAAGTTFTTLLSQLNRFAAFSLANKGSKDDAERLEVYEALGDKLRGLSAKKPVVVRAVFHIEDKYKEAGKISPAENLPLRLYAWHDDKTWHLEDLTDPRRTFTDDCPYEKPAKASDPDEPPQKLFEKLNWKEHFPKGYIHYVLPSGHFDRVKTTAEPEWSDYVKYAAAGLMVAGLVVGTLGAGTPAAATAATVLFVTGGITQAAGDALHLHEMASHGLHDPGQQFLDVLDIVASLASAGTLGARAFITAGTEATAAAKLSTSAVQARLLAAQGLRVLSFVAASTDVANLLVATKEFIEQYDAIDDSPLGPDEKLQAKALLILKMAGTTALTVWSVKGAVEDIHFAVKAGRTLKLNTLAGGGVGEVGVADLRADWGHKDYADELEKQLKGGPAEEFKTNVKVVEDAEEWKKLTSGSELGAAVMRNEGGVPMLYIRAGANPSRIAEEAVHFLQFKDPALKPLFDKLSEGALKRWPKMKTAERLELVKAKLQIEIDAQRRLIKDLSASGKVGTESFAALDDAWQNLDHLQGKLVQASAVDAKDVDALRKAGAAVPELTEDVPRLFSKVTTETTPLDESWRTLSEDAFVDAYNGKYPNSGLSEADLRERYRSSKRLSPDTWRLVGMDRAAKKVPSVRADFEGAARRYTAKDSSSQDALSFGYSERKDFEAAFKKRDAARQEAEKYRSASDFETNPAMKEKWGKAMAAMREQSRIIGEAAAAKAVEKEVAQDMMKGTTLERVYGGAGKPSRSGDFDLVFSYTNKDGKKVAVVVEAKGGSSPLGAAETASGYAEQGTQAYFDYIMGNMRKGTDEMKKAAKVIDGADEIKYLHVKAKIPTDLSGASVPGEVVVSTFKL